MSVDVDVVSTMIIRCPMMTAAMVTDLERNLCMYRTRNSNIKK